MSVLTSLHIAARTGIGAMRANPVRALLATLGVVIGSASLVAVLAVSDGVEQFARVSASRRGFDRVNVRPITQDTLDGQWVPRDEVAELGIPDLASVSRVLKPGEVATLQVQGVVVTELGAAGRPRALAVRALAYSAPDTIGRPLSSGRHLTPEESRTGAPVALVNESLARTMLADSARPVSAVLGDSVSIGGHWLRIVGVLAPDEGAPGRERLELDASYPLVASAIGSPSGGRVVPVLTISTARAEEVRAMRDRVERWLVQRDPGWRTDYRLEARAESQLRDMERGLLIFRLLMGSITGITLVVGGIGIMNVLLASVAERTREIGVRKAVGARRRDIMFQFLAESVTITGAGSAIGTVLGLGTAYAVTAIMRAETQAVIYAATTTQTLGVVALLAVVVGVVFGTYPALRAARLAPVDAIHTE